MSEEIYNDLHSVNTACKGPYIIYNILYYILVAVHSRFNVTVDDCHKMFVQEMS